MVETDWKEILNFSQRELKKPEKEKLCEKLSWMEADDIELNFSDLKSLFRLAQDMLKYKSKQVNGLLGQLDTLKRKYTKVKEKKVIDSPEKDSAKTVTHQEELIKANKDILQQLYTEIAELERRKNKLQTDGASESSRDTLSEVEAISQLETEVQNKNRHIKKLLHDVKVLEEENVNVKEKLSVFQNKLKESTQLIENLTEQLYLVNSQCTQLKAALGKCEEDKVQYKHEIQSLNEKLEKGKSPKRTNIYDDQKLRIKELKEIIKKQNDDIDNLNANNDKLKEEITQIKHSSLNFNQLEEQTKKITELQEKLAEASKQMLESADLINVLKMENLELKKTNIRKVDQSISNTKNESDENTYSLIKSLEKNNENLRCALKGAEEMVVLRERELSEISTELQLLQTNDGIRSLLKGLKNKKLEMKIRDEGIKTLVQEINNLNEQISDLEIENETMRQKLNIPPSEIIDKSVFLKEYYDMKLQYNNLSKALKKNEDKLVSIEVDTHFKDQKISKLYKLLNDLGYHSDKVDAILNDINFNNEEDKIQHTIKDAEELNSINQKIRTEYNELLEENEGLRTSLAEILNCLKDNSSTSSGVLTLECPSLDSVLQSMEARKAAGWFAPHMKTLLELRTALGGRDALLTALHESRKETFEAMSKLSSETKKSIELEKELSALKSTIDNKTEDFDNESINLSDGEFGSWIKETDYKDIDLLDEKNVNLIITKGDIIYEKQLKQYLLYFKNRFVSLYEKFTNLSIRVLEDKNLWALEQEKHKIEIDKLKSQINDSNEDDISEPSPGLVEVPNKCALKPYKFLEENYKYMKTSYENVKNEMLENKKETLILASHYENQIQNLTLNVLELSAKLRKSIPIDLFWNQNKMLQDFALNYRNQIEKCVTNAISSQNLLRMLKNNKSDIINSFKSHLHGNAESSEELIMKLDKTVEENQIVVMCKELENKSKEIEMLKSSIQNLQRTENDLLRKIHSNLTNEEIFLLMEDIKQTKEENKFLKKELRDLTTKLDITTSQLQAYSQKELCSEIELDSLRHQVLDLQSKGENKASLSRLSSELLITQLQATENLKKIESLKMTVNKEIQLRLEAEDVLQKQQKIFDVYLTRNNEQFRNHFEVMELLRQQYQGILPLISLENYLENLNNISHKNLAVTETLNEIEDTRDTLMMKHAVYNQILDLSKSNCSEDESCPHKIKYIMMEKTQNLDIDHCNKQIDVLEKSRQSLLEKNKKLEKTLILLNQGFKMKSLSKSACTSVNSMGDDSVEVDDIQSDTESNKKENATYTLSTKSIKEDAKQIQKVTKNEKSVDTKNIYIQTIVKTENKEIQTDNDATLQDLKDHVDRLEKDIARREQMLNEYLVSSKEQSQKLQILNNNELKLRKENADLNEKIKNLIHTHDQKNNLCTSLQSTIDTLKRELNDLKNKQVTQTRWKDETSEENKTLLLTIKKVENDKNIIIEEYKKLLNNEREEFSRSVREFQSKLSELQSQLDDRKESKNNVNTGVAINTKTSEKLHSKILELEDKCFKLNSELETCESELKTCESELERWKNLAFERLTKMEQLSVQIKERHNQEVESYKAENEHWLVQLNETQREHMELRTKLAEQKALHVKQLAEKDAHIDHLRSIINNLKTQIMGMQQVISINDPSFDLSAIVEVEEASDAISHQDSDRLELKFDSTGDLIEDDIGKFPSSSTAIWQEPLIERLRREKQLVSKQNAILRKQIKSLAGRERRARLDAQNLKNQVFRISTSGHKVPSAESAALQNKIATLQAQLTSARRDAHSTVALWDKWKRAQQSSERWQARYEDKCQEVIKLESSLNLARSAVQRLEKEKRMLLSRLSEAKSDKSLTIEKHDAESSEKTALVRQDYCDSPPPLSNKTLLERIEAQQRRIVALKVAEKGNEPLVSEYEKSLAEITSLKGQVLKLESALLEAQIKSPLKSNHDNKPELEYWKSYCEMLKEENMQLTLKVSSLESAPASHQRVNDLEQTILTLRGLVSKLQAEQKSSNTHKRADSRPTSGRTTDKNRNQNVEMYRTEISNLKRSIQEKDLLLEKSKEMLKIAAEREEDLLRENMMLRRRLEQISDHKDGFTSA